MRTWETKIFMLNIILYFFSLFHTKYSKSIFYYLVKGQFLMTWTIDVFVNDDFYKINTQFLDPYFLTKFDDFNLIIRLYWIRKKKKHIKSEFYDDVTEKYFYAQIFWSFWNQIRSSIFIFAKAVLFPSIPFVWCYLILHAKAVIKFESLPY